MRQINRRSFMESGLKTGVALGGLSLTSKLFGNEIPGASNSPDISVVKGTNYFQSTIQAIENLGGIGKFISKGDKVGLLANSSYKKPGTYTRPEVMLAVAYLCFEAGAGEVYSFKKEEEKYWRRSDISVKHRKLIDRLKPDDSDRVEIKVPEGKILKEAKVLKGFLDYDKVINIPIVKNHGEIKMTCTLKNTMGISGFSTNIKFHLGRNYVKGAVKMIGNMYHNMEHLAQCIADLNKVRKFDLYVVDATEFITSNGPSGPGDMSKPDKVVAGSDPVAVDAICTQYLGLKPDDSVMLKKAYKDKLGEMDLGKLTVSETSS